MTEILKTNFEENFTLLESLLKDAIFVAIDGEFSGIRGRMETPSLFNTNEDRYAILKEHIKNYLIIQFGLTVFHYDKENNVYTAHVFNIFLLPRPIGFGERDFQFQVSCLEFLCKYGFDFNKLMYGGVSYMTQEAEAELRDSLSSGKLWDQLVQMREDYNMDSDMSKVIHWLVEAKEGDSMLLTYVNQVHSFLLHHEIRSIPNSWTEVVPNSKQQIRVLKVSVETRNKLQEDCEANDYGEHALNEMLGFSRIFTLLSNMKVPLIGHNMLLDLLLSYKLFIAPLPDKLQDFKRKICDKLGSIYDTKFISLEIRNKLPLQYRKWKCCLPNLYSLLNSNEFEKLAPSPPIIKTDAYNLNTTLGPSDEFSGEPCVTNCCGENGIEDSADHNGKLDNDDCSVNSDSDRESSGQDAPQPHFHEAGWDSFCTGYVFLKLAHVNAHMDRYSKEVTEYPPLTWTELHQSVLPYTNKVHISMGKSSHMFLSGKDMNSNTHRPRLLHIETRDGSDLDIDMLYSLFIKFGEVDIKLISYSRALMAAPTHGCIIDILKRMKTHPTVKVEVYSVIRHNRVLRTFMGVGAVLSIFSGLVVAFFSVRPHLK